MGISSGAALAIAAAAKGLNIPKPTLYEPPFMVDNRSHHPPADALQQIKTMIAARRRTDAVKFFLKDMIGLLGIALFFMKLMPILSKT